MRILWIFCASVRRELAEVVGGNWNLEERMKEAENDGNLQVLRQSLFLVFGKTSLLVWTRTRWSRPTNCTIQNVSSLMRR